MSYATSLQMAYLPPYGPSTLLSDDLVHRTSVLPYYTPSSQPYRTGSHLLSDDFIHNSAGLPPSSYRSAAIPYLSAITDWQRDIPAQTSYASINHVREYSSSIGTASNTNTASTVAHSNHENNLNSSKNKLSTNINRYPSDADRQPPLTTIWSSRRPKQPTQDEQPPVNYQSLPELSTTKRQLKSPVEEIRKDPTPPPPPPPPPVLIKQESNTTTTTTTTITTTEPEKEPEQPSIVDNHVMLTESTKDSPVDELSVEQSWANKIDQLHTTQAQREKDKVKAARVLPQLPAKKIAQRPVVSTDRTGRTSPYQRRNASYFDSLFDGNYYRKPSTYQQSSSSLSPRNKPSPNSPGKPKTTIVSKQVAPRKAPQNEPPSLLTNRTAPIPTTTWKKQGQNQSPIHSLTSRENVPKDTDERFREALQKFRTDRAEQQQRELTESTAKRLNYGNYVRRSTKDGSLRNVVKPSPWADFMDTKKGNVYNLEQEEKKELYNQSKSYGERVRFRNFTIHNVGETAPLSYRPYLFPIENEKEHQSDDEATNSDNGSNSTLKSNRKKTATTNNMTSEQSGRSSSSNQVSDDEDERASTRKEKKRLYDSSVPATSATEESDNDQTTEQRNTDDDLATLREEKTLESLEGVRSKKR